MTLIPFPVTSRTAVLLDTAVGYVARAEIHSRAIAFLSDQMNRTAEQMVAQGLDQRTVTEQMIALFDAIEARVNGMGCRMPAHVKITVRCTGMDIIRDQAGRDMTG